MASVTTNNARKYRYLGQESDDEMQEKKVVTLRDKIFKQFLAKQLSVTNSLEEQSKKEFVKAATEESITKTASGLLSSKEFYNHQTENSINEILSASGLSKYEIKLLLNENYESSSLEAPFARECKLQEISKKLSKRQELLESSTSKPEQFSSAFPLNRHDFEEECSTVPLTNGADRLTACLVRLEPHHNKNLPADHPINHISELAQEIFPNDKRSEISSYTNKRKASENVPELPKKKKVPDLEFKYFTEKPKSFWDMKEIPKVIRGNKCQNVNKLECNSSIKIVGKTNHNKCSIDKTKPFIFPLDPSELVPLQEIYANKKTLKEIKTMEKFINYNAGEPSKTLYIKNLPHKINPSDLASILGHFESLAGPKNVYRILDGRMRGQAFVTFQDEKAAMRALNTCNGYILDGKPMVIAYGKK